MVNGCARASANAIEPVKNNIVITVKSPCLLNCPSQTMWNMMGMNERILCRKRLEIFANEMTQRDSWWWLFSVYMFMCSVNGMECHEHTADDSFLRDTINYHERQCYLCASFLQHNRYNFLIILQTCESFKLSE